MDEKAQTALPTGWFESSIGDITLPVQKVDPLDDPGREIEYIDISSIDNVRNIVGEPKHFRMKDAPSRARQIIRTGDVLFATVRPYLRNIAAVPPRYDGQIASTGFSVLRPASGIEPAFLFYKSTSTDFVNALSVEQYGVSYPAVTDDQVREQSILVPPRNEQRRITTKIEELFSELDNGIESIKVARDQLKVYRYALLRAAFEGKITAQWRKKNKSKLESADHLIARIKKERDADYHARISARNPASDDNGGRPRPPKVFAPLTKQELEELPVLPDGWIWEKLGWMTCGVEYGTAAKSSERGKVPVLRMGNIQNAKFDWSDLVYTSDQDEIRKYSLREGDVLFNRTNSPELVGKTAIYRGERPALFAGYLIRLNQLPTIVDSQYLNLFLNSHIAQQRGNRVKTDGVNQSNINGEKLSNYPFPYCSLAEQREIVKILEEKLSVVDQMEEDANLQIQKANALRQSILKKAFSGRLVAQDPNDEPASVLLERIRTEKAEKEASIKKIKRKDAA